MAEAETLKESEDFLTNIPPFNLLPGKALRELAFSLMMLLRFQNHLGQINRGETLDNFINPDELGRIQRSVLKVAFKSIEQLQRRIEIRYGISTLGTR